MIKIIIQNINYNQSVYRVYSQSIKLDPLQLYFVGIYDDAYFQKVGLRINYNLLSVLLFTLVVLIAFFAHPHPGQSRQRGKAFSVPNYPSGYLDGLGSGDRFFSTFYQRPHHPGGYPSSGNPTSGKGIWHPNLHYHKGIALQRLGKTKEACQEWRIAAEENLAAAVEAIKKACQ